MTWLDRLAEASPELEVGHPSDSVEGSRGPLRHHGAGTPPLCITETLILVTTSQRTRWRVPKTPPSLSRKRPALRTTQNYISHLLHLTTRSVIYLHPSQAESRPLGRHARDGAPGHCRPGYTVGLEKAFPAPCNSLVCIDTNSGLSNSILTCIITQISGAVLYRHIFSHYHEPNEDRILQNHTNHGSTDSPHRNHM